LDFRNLEIIEKQRLLDYIISKFDLKPLPFEGGYFIETFRSGKTVFNEDHSGIKSRSLCTSIIYLITSGSFSKLHRLPGEEIFHFYFGDPVKMLNISESGKAEIIMLGNEFEKGEVPQHVVGGNCWQGIFLSEEKSPVFALLGTTMSPGFDLNDYESAAGHKDILLKNYPEFSEVIKKLV
jgi:predicted cupin superfamily sugar epimerase